VIDFVEHIVCWEVGGSLEWVAC